MYLGVSLFLISMNPLLIKKKKKLFLVAKMHYTPPEFDVVKLISQVSKLRTKILNFQVIVNVTLLS